MASIFRKAYGSVYGTAVSSSTILVTTGVRPGGISSMRDTSCHTGGVGGWLAGNRELARTQLPGSCSSAGPACNQC